MSEQVQAKKPKWALWLLILFIACVWVVATTGGNKNRVSRSYATPRPSRIAVEYRVTGSCRRAHLTYENADGNTEQQEVSVPWTLKLTVPRGQFLYVSAQNDNDHGTINCAIYEDGREVEGAESAGAYVISTCSRSAGE